VGRDFLETGFGERGGVTRDDKSESEDEALPFFFLSAFLATLVGEGAETLGEEKEEDDN